MKISVITSFPFPNGKATANRVKVLVNELIKSPHIDYIEIFCCSNDEEQSYLIQDSIRVTNLKINPINKNRFFTRAFLEFKLALRLIMREQLSKFELTIITVPSIMLLFPLIFYRRKNFLALDLRDAVWSYFQKDFFSSFLSKLISLAFSFVAKKAEIISVTNVVEYEETKLITGRAPIIVANGISEERLSEIESLGFYEEKKSKVLGYIGNIGIAQNLDQLIDFSRDITNIDIQIIGDGAKLDDLKQKCSYQNIENVTFSGLVSPDKVTEYIKTIDILFAQIAPEYRSAVPTKVFEYIASGKKVLLGLPDGPAKDIFSKFYGVEIFDVGKRSSFLESYDRLCKFQYTYLHRKKNIAILREAYLRESSAMVLVRAIEALNTTQTNEKNK